MIIETSASPMIASGLSSTYAGRRIVPPVASRESINLPEPQPVVLDEFV